VKKVLVTALVGAVLLVAYLRLFGRKQVEGGAAAGDAVPVSASVSATATTMDPPSMTVAAATAVAPATSDAAACARLAELCSTSDGKIDVAACESKLGDSRKLTGPGNVDRSKSCVAEAKTCAAATGCMSGGIGMGAMGEFLKGFGSALSK
jgi:hypothetical protein